MPRADGRVCVFAYPRPGPSRIVDPTRAENHIVASHRYTRVRRRRRRIERTPSLFFLLYRPLIVSSVRPSVCVSFYPCLG